MTKDQPIESNPTAAPEGWEASYDDADGSVIEYIGPSISRPGYCILQSWSAKDGRSAFIDHHRDGPFTLAEMRDLRDQLSTMLAEND